LAEFAKAFEGASISPGGRISRWNGNRNETEGIFRCRQAAAFAGWTTFSKMGYPKPPRLSINYGAAGAAYALYRLAERS
jgi:hypothetical protein